MYKMRLFYLLRSLESSSQLVTFVLLSRKRKITASIKGPKLTTIILLLKSVKRFIQPVCSIKAFNQEIDERKILMTLKHNFILHLVKKYNRHILCAVLAVFLSSCNSEKETKIQIIPISKIS